MECLIALSGIERTKRILLACRKGNGAPGRRSCGRGAKSRDSQFRLRLEHAFTTLA